jgi:hypothetical protein
MPAGLLVALTLETASRTFQARSAWHLLSYASEQEASGIRDNINGFVIRKSNSSLILTLTN